MRQAWITVALAVAVIVGYLLWPRRRPIESPPPPPRVSTPPPSGPLGVIDGEVILSGSAPAPGKLHREADPYCARKEMADPTVLVANGKLANVWVHVVKGAPDSPAPPASVEIDQRDCMYTPRMTTAVVGQKIVARNDDPILH